VQTIGSVGGAVAEPIAHYGAAMSTPPNGPAGFRSLIAEYE